MLCYHCMHDKEDTAVCPYCHEESAPAPAAHHLVPGTLIHGRYIVGKALGEGGFSITYIGLDKKRDLIVSIKQYYHPETGSDTQTFENGKQMLLKKAREFARFGKDRNFAEVIDYFEENNTAYAVTEYLDGVTLSHYLDVRGTLSPEDACEILLPLMRSLKKIHAAGLCHCSICPDNIFMLQDGSFKLTVFGTVWNYGKSDYSYSEMVNPGYSPEEAYRLSGSPGPWTDVYSICAVLYRCITGEAPIESIDRVNKDQLRFPSDLGILISPRMEDVLAYGLAVRKEDRCPDMTELLSRIDEAQNKPDKVSATTGSQQEEPATVQKESDHKPSKPIKPEPAESGNLQVNHSVGTTTVALCASILALFVFLARNLYYALGVMYHYSALMYIIVPVVSIVLGFIVFFVCKRNPNAFPVINTVIGLSLAVSIGMTTVIISIYDGMTTIWTVGGIVVTLLTGIVIGTATAVYSVRSGENPPALRVKPGVIALTYIIYFAAMYIYILRTPVQFSFLSSTRIVVGIVAVSVGIAVFLFLHKHPKSEKSIIAVVIIMLLLMIPAYLASVGRISIPHGGTIELILGSVNTAVIEAVILAKVLRRKKAAA